MSKVQKEFVTLFNIFIQAFTVCYFSFFVTVTTPVHWLPFNQSTFLFTTKHWQVGSLIIIQMILNNVNDWQGRKIMKPLDCLSCSICLFSCYLHANLPNICQYIDLITVMRYRKYWNRLLYFSLHCCTNDPQMKGWVKKPGCYFDAL